MSTNKKHTIRNNYKFRCLET